MSTLSCAYLVSYRRAGQSRGSPHKAIVPGDTDPVASLEALLGPIEQVTVLETWHRPIVVDDDEPGPLVLPPVVAERVHVIDVAEAWAVGQHDIYRWTFGNGRRGTIGAALAHNWHSISHKRLVAGASP